MNNNNKDLPSDTQKIPGSKPVEEIDMNSLLNFIPYFENIDLDKAFCREPAKKREDGVWILGYTFYEDRIMEFITAFYSSGIRCDGYLSEFDRLIPNWKTADMKEVVKTADLHLVRVIFTSTMRADYFCQGALEDYTRNGLILCILRRLKELHI
jgi:hypothetical protein